MATAALAGTGSQSPGRRSLPGPTPAPAPGALPTSCYVFISLVGSNRLLIEINSENIFQTLKHAPPLIYVLKINPGGQPVKSVNCGFRHKSVKNMRRAPPGCGRPLSVSRRVCLRLGAVDSGPGVSVGDAGAAGSTTAWPTACELPGLGLTLSSPCFPCLKRGTLKHLL